MSIIITDDHIMDDNDSIPLEEIPIDTPDPPTHTRGPGVLQFAKNTFNRTRMKEIVRKRLPILTWLPNYNIREWLKADLSAGITVGVMLIPQSMAYAMVAGLPPIYGLYSSFIPLLIFGMFTTSLHLSVGPFAIISLLVNEAVRGYLRDQVDDVQLYVGVTLLLTFLCGILSLLFGLLRFGFLVNFLSDPVRSGFNSASAIIIAASQLAHLFNVTIPEEDFLWMTLYELAIALPKTNGWSVLIGVIGIAMLLGLKKIGQKYKVTIPSALIVVGVGTFISWVANLEHNAGIKVVGLVPSGLPPISDPFTGVPHIWSAVSHLLPPAFVITVVTYISSMAISTKFADQFHYKVDGNQEFLAIGFANLVGCFFSCYPLAASLSRSAVNVASGARTALSGIVSTLLVVVSLLFLAPVVYYIPSALLASIVMVAVYDIIDYKQAIILWKTHRRDFALLIICFVATLAIGDQRRGKKLPSSYINTSIGILQGLLIGVGASLLVIIYRNAYPPIAELGRLPGSHTYANRIRFPQSITIPGLVVVRFDGSLYFANKEHIRSRLIAYSQDNKISWIVLDCSSMLDIDSTAMHVLKELMSELKHNNVQLFFACLKGPIRDAFKRWGIVGEMGQNHFFWSVHDAILLYYAYVLKEQPPDIVEEAQHSHIQMQADQALSASMLIHNSAAAPEYSPFMFKMEETKAR